MHIVTVVFEVEPKSVNAFMAEMLLQADNSLLHEPDCHQFDVCQDTQTPHRIFLYEVYSNEGAFKAHLASNHYAAFTTRTKNWITSKHVDNWERAN